MKADDVIQTGTGPRFKDSECLIRIDGFDGVEPGVLYDIDGTHPENRLIFDDEDIWRGIQIV